jgi:hypothetical protein
MLAISRLGSFDYLLDWVRSHSIFCYYLFIPDFYGLFVFIFVVFFLFLFLVSRCGAIGFCATVPSGIHRPPPVTTTSGMIILPNRLLFHKYFTFARHIHTHTHTHTARVVMNRPSTCHFSFDTFFHKLGNFFLFQKNYFFALFF